MKNNENKTPSGASEDTVTLALEILAIPLMLLPIVAGIECFRLSVDCPPHFLLDYNFILFQVLTAYWLAPHFEDSES